MIVNAFKLCRLADLRCQIAHRNVSIATGELEVAIKQLEVEQHNHSELLKRVEILRNNIRRDLVEAPRVRTVLELLLAELQTHDPAEELAATQVAVAEHEVAVKRSSLNSTLTAYRLAVAKKARRDQFYRSLILQVNQRKELRADESALENWASGMRTNK